MCQLYLAMRYVAHTCGLPMQMSKAMQMGSTLGLPGNWVLCMNHLASLLSEAQTEELELPGQTIRRAVCLGQATLC